MKPKKKHPQTPAYQSPGGTNLGDKSPRQWVREIVQCTTPEARRAKLATVIPEEWRPLVEYGVRLQFTWAKFHRGHQK